jgi:hypothetical protein
MRSSCRSVHAGGPTSTRGRVAATCELELPLSCAPAASPRCVSSKRRPRARWRPHIHAQSSCCPRELEPSASCSHPAGGRNRGRPGCELRPLSVHARIAPLSRPRGRTPRRTAAAVLLCEAAREMHARRDVMYLWLSSLHEIKMPGAFCSSLGDDFGNAQFHFERQNAFA